MYTWRDYRIVELEQAERREKAQQGRIRNAAAKNTRSRAAQLYGPMMAKIGGLLMTWGQRLQNRYAEFSAAQRSRSAEEVLRAELDRILAQS